MLDGESARAVPAGTEVALTVDDLPAHAPLPPGATRLGIAARMIEALISHGAHGTVGFVNGAAVDGHPEHEAILRAWDDARLPLGSGEEPEMRLVRFRTLGCYPLTGAVESSAASLEAIVAEMIAARTSERGGRLIDKEASASMEKKKREGYF